MPIATWCCGPSSLDRAIFVSLYANKVLNFCGDSLESHIRRCVWDQKTRTVQNRYRPQLSELTWRRRACRRAVSPEQSFWNELEENSIRNRLRQNKPSPLFMIVIFIPSIGHNRLFLAFILPGSFGKRPFTAWMSIQNPLQLPLLVEFRRISRRCHENLHSKRPFRNPRQRAQKRRRSKTADLTRIPPRSQGAL